VVDCSLHATDGALDQRVRYKAEVAGTPGRLTICTTAQLQTYIR